MLEAFLTFINQQKLDLSEKTTLLTVSGGTDSVVLADLFYRAGFSAAVAHCNFGLRGEESEEDERFVKEMAARYNFPCHVRKFETKSFAKRHGISTQMAARDLRYEWFEEVRVQHAYSFIATAHHINDSFETVLLNLVRGTGMAGLQGIAVQKNHLIRPLLFASKDEIHTYIQENHLLWREDSSNKSNDYKRNLIRNEVMPVLRQMNPALESTFKSTSQRFQSAGNLLEGFLQGWKEEVVKKVNGELCISIPALLASSEPVYRLWFLLQDSGFSYLQAEEIYKSSTGISGKIFRSATYEVLKDRDCFIVSEQKKQQSADTVWIDKPDGNYGNENLVLSLKKIVCTTDFKIERKENIAYLDAEKLLFPLCLRTWAIGDSFCPFGMHGKKKKVSDLLVDLKLSLFQKQEVKVLVNGNGEILWVIGIRTDERYKITSNTNEALLVSKDGLGYPETVFIE